MPPPLNGGPCHDPRPGHGMEQLASVCRAGSETPQGGAPWTEHSLRKKDGWGGAGERLESSDTLPLPQAQALDTFLDPTGAEQTERQRKRLSGVCPSHPSPDPHLPAGARELGEPRLTSREKPGLSGAWTREDGTHVDSVASGGIWGSRGARAPHEIHAAFKVSVYG